MASLQLILVVFLAFASSLEARRERCVLISSKTTKYCQHMGYSKTLSNASDQLDFINDYSKDLRNCTMVDSMPLVCSDYLPMCVRRGKKIRPCREFCERSLGSCPSYYQNSMPKAFNCSQYPAIGEETCVNGQNIISRKGNVSSYLLSYCATW